MTDDTAVIIIVIIMLHDSSVYVYVWLTMLHDRWYSWGLSETTLWTSSSMSELKRPRKFLVLDSEFNILQLNWMIRDWKRGVLSKQMNKSIFNLLRSQLLCFSKFLAHNAYFFEFSAQNAHFFEFSDQNAFFCRIFSPAWTSSSPSWTPCRRTRRSSRPWARGWTRGSPRPRASPAAMGQYFANVERTRLSSL